MPTNPTPAQQEASRTNGARSHGPVSEAGKERIREAATRHGLTGGFRLLPGEEELFASLRGEYWRRLRPNDAAEAAAVDKIVMALWRERRLEVIESRLALALATGAPTDGLPSLATLIRYRARIARDRRNGEEELARLRRLAARWSQARSAAATAGPAVAPAEPNALGAGEAADRPETSAWRAKRTEEPDRAAATVPGEPVGEAAAAAGWAKATAAIAEEGSAAAAQPAASGDGPSVAEAELVATARVGTPDRSADSAAATVPGEPVGEAAAAAGWAKAIAAIAEEGSAAAAQPAPSGDGSSVAEAELVATARVGTPDEGADSAAATVPEDGRRAATAEARGTAARSNAAADRAYRALLDEIGRELALLARDAGEPLPPALAGAPGARPLGPLLAEAFRAPLTRAELARLDAAARRGAGFLGAQATAARPGATASEAAALAAQGGEVIPIRSCRVACS